MRIVRDGKGCGGFLCPPGHPNHEYVLLSGSSNNPDMIASIETAFEPQIDAPAHIIREAREILAGAELKCSEAWIRSVYGYFRYCYSPDGENRNASACLTSGKLLCQCGTEFYTPASLARHLDREASLFSPPEAHHQVPGPVYPAEHHLGYLHVRSYFPDHQIRTDLIESGSPRGYGSFPCAKCGQGVQYEARYNALVVYPRGRECPNGGPHEIEQEPTS